MDIRAALVAASLIAVACNHSSTDTGKKTSQAREEGSAPDGIYCFDIVRGTNRKADYLCNRGLELCGYTRKSMIEAVRAQVPEAVATDCEITTEKVYCFKSVSEGLETETCSADEKTCEKFVQKWSENPNFKVLSRCRLTGGE